MKLSEYLKNKRVYFFIFFVFALIFLVSFILYRLPVKAVIYPVLLCVLSGAVITAVDFRKALKKHRRLSDMKKLSHELINYFPACETTAEKDYQEIILNLKREHENLIASMNTRFTDMVDYYTVWAHQIKTPISSMRLTLQNDDCAQSLSLSGDLFRIEQYVEMVLAFLRLNSDSTDYVFREHSLDNIIKSCVKRFSGEFIGRKIKLEYRPVNLNIITDEKWLSFVIEQILSNALKYTEKGSVRIYMEGEVTLCIEDTGIGIAPEDLPRIFENGFTGYNGRSDKRASGIGLYLCRRICRNLNIGISARSVPDKGTVISLRFDPKKLITE